MKRSRREITKAAAVASNDGSHREREEEEEEEEDTNKVSAVLTPSGTVIVADPSSSADPNNAAAAEVKSKRASVNSSSSILSSSSAAVLPLLQTPHTIRLLKLIREGSVEYAETAVLRLEQTAAALSPVQLWDLLGRLTDILFAPTWKTRQAAASALQVVARHLPVADQCDFLERASFHHDHNCINSNSSIVASEVTNSKYHSTIETSSKLDDSDVDALMSRQQQQQQSKALYLTVNELLQENGESSIDRVLAQGRELLATAESRYDVGMGAGGDNRDGKYDNDDNALRSLDRSCRTTVSSSSVASDDSIVVAESSSFVQARVQLQRRILAGRLGLAAIDDAIGGDAIFAADAITSGDLLLQSAPSISSSPKTTRQKHAERIQQAAAARKTKKTKDSETTTDHHETSAADEAVELESNNPHTVRALLVMEMQAQQQQLTASYSHSNPQALLATELIYRMLDPVWYVRHGAVLGILALLRAWRDHHLLSPRLLDETTTTSSSRSGSARRFGAWPQDILARCLCVLALDRFGDYSGGALDFSDDAVANDVSSSTSVVAPVREVVGQTVSVLLAMAPDSVVSDALAVLFRQCQFASEWEVRHGALVALKYVVVVETTGIMVANRATKSTLVSRDETKSTIAFIARVAMEHLLDDSDDVKSVAAQILIEFGRGESESKEEERKHLPEFLGDAVQPLWCALQSVRSVSSCIVDLVALFAMFVDHDCFSFLCRINAISSESFDGLDLADINNVIRMLLRLLDSDFLSVRVSALRSIGVLSRDSAFVSRSHKHSKYQSLSETMQLLVERVFDLFFMPSEDSASDADEHTETYPHAILEETWKRLSDTCIDLLKTEDRDCLDYKVLSRYFEIGHERSTETNDAPVQVEAAVAIAYFLCRSTSFESISDLAQASLLSYLHSPWTSQCEASCLLYRALVNRLANRSSLQSFEDSLNQDVPLLCLDERILIADSSSLGVACDRTFLSAMADVVSGSKCPPEAADAVVRVWTEEVQSNGGPVSLESRRMSPVSSMRIRAMLAGAVLTKGLPSKLTPIVRALMTSFTNESASVSRKTQTCAYLTQLLQLIGGEAEFERAHTKILNTLCDAVIFHSNNTEIGSARKACAASSVLRSLVQTVPGGRTLADIGPLWSRLLPLSKAIPSITEHSVLLDSISLLEVLCGGLSPDQVLTSSLIDDCVPTLIDLACADGPGDFRNSAVSSVVALCTVYPGHLLQVAIPILTDNLEDRSHDCRRLSACLLLGRLMEAAGTEICPFVRCLLPLVLSLVTDHMVECAQSANGIFALLVRVAPLVRQRSSVRMETLDEHGESVIDHLIFGKPLPTCDFPIELRNALNTRQIVLRNYQKEGIAWLQFLRTVNLSGALCDDMGTGKSVQALMAVALAHSDLSDSSRPSKPLSLVVCPSTLVGHWAGEIEKYFPSQSIFKSLCLVGSRSERQALWNSKPDPVNIVITSYAVLRSDVDYLETERWCYCILDEGHLLKNPKTATARASRRLRACNKLILTGTPIQNRVHELWATFDFLMPNFLGTSTAFVKSFANPIAKGQLPGASASNIADGIAKLKVLHQQVLPFILRREKNQVLPELPATTLTIVRVPMSGIQERIYRDFCARKDASKSLDAFGKALDDPSSQAPGMSADVLKSLLFLRLVCTHPSLVLSKSQSETCPASFFTLGASGKILALAELLREAGLYEDDITGADNDASLLYCDDEADDQDAYISVLETPEHFVGSLVSTSGEFGIRTASSPSKCLVFAQFTKSLDAVEEFLFKAHMPSLRYVRLDGTVTPDKRMQVVNAFERDPCIRVMLLTTRVGGLGLNLTAASTVIFLESDFNPYADIQAQDRCRRIGQTKVVNVYRIVTSNSVEEKILVLQEKKMQVAEAIVNTDNSTMYSMGTDRLLDVFTLRGSKDVGGDDATRLDYDLEGLVERCADDYKSLSVSQFTGSFADKQ